MDIFYELREVPLKKPSTSELLDWLKLLNEDMPLEVLQDANPNSAIPPMHGALLKNEQDVMLFERLPSWPAASNRLRRPMFYNFMDELRDAGIGASLKEHLTLLQALEKNVIEQTPEAFYASRARPS